MSPEPVSSSLHCLIRRSSGVSELPPRKSSLPFPYSLFKTMFMEVNACECGYLQRPGSSDPPGIRIKGGCEQPHLKTGSQPQLPCESGRCSSPPSHPSSSSSLDSLVYLQAITLPIFKSRNTQICVPFAGLPDLF